MSLRTRLLVAFVVVATVPLALLALGLRHEMTSRISAEYEARLESALDVIALDLRLEGAAIDDRLDSLRSALERDSRFRAAAVAGADDEQEYLLDLAGTLMRLAALSMLQIQDESGRILSSGHFRNEHGRIEAGVPETLTSRSGEVTLVSARAPRGEFLALARARPLTLGGRRFILVGGTAIDDPFLRRLARDPAVSVTLWTPERAGSAEVAPDGPGAAAPNAGIWRRDLRLPLLRPDDAGRLERDDARLVLTQPRTPLNVLLRRTDAWFLSVAALAGITALLLAIWTSSRISRPIAALADKTSVLDLDRLDVAFDEGTDEVGRLSRLLGDLAARLRASTARIREAERRATLGDLARQVNHDIKNGLIPLRNVMRHLVQVGRQEPHALPTVLAERRPTIDSSIDYLDTLARHYERLARPSVTRACDLNAIVDEVVSGLRGAAHVDVTPQLAEDLPSLVADPVSVRRIVENLAANAVDSLESRPGRITLATERISRQDEPPIIRLTVADTGHGMSNEEAARIFTDFYTTRPSGTGLGLSIVRRLVMDLHGSIRVESAPGRGTRMIVDLPVRRAA